MFMIECTVVLELLASRLPTDAAQAQAYAADFLEAAIEMACEDPESYQSVLGSDFTISVRGRREEGALVLRLEAAREGRTEADAEEYAKRFVDGALEVAMEDPEAYQSALGDAFTIEAVRSIRVRAVAI